MITEAGWSSSFSLVDHDKKFELMRIYRYEGLSVCISLTKIFLFKNFFVRKRLVKNR